MTSGRNNNCDTCIFIIFPPFTLLLLFINYYCYPFVDCRFSVSSFPPRVGVRITIKKIYIHTIVSEHNLHDDDERVPAHRERETLDNLMTTTRRRQYCILYCLLPYNIIIYCMYVLLYDYRKKKYIYIYTTPVPCLFNDDDIDDFLSIWYTQQYIRGKYYNTAAAKLSSSSSSSFVI